MNAKIASTSLPDGLVSICPSDALNVGGLGVRFEVVNEREARPAFVVRHSDGISAYINRCVHQALELDWNMGHFFDADQIHLICASHGALYTADTGQCVGGPCNRSRLEALFVVETGGTVYLSDSRYTDIRREQ
jgi:nitrite reductase/ring-hydroxylating ferredoxin subunit